MLQRASPPEDQAPTFVDMVILLGLHNRMLSTVALAAVVFGQLILSALLWAVFLRLGLRWTKVADVTRRRQVVATSVVMVLQTAINVVFLGVMLRLETDSIVLDLVELCTGVAVQLAIICRVFKVQVRRALQAWLPTLLVSFAVLAFSILVTKPFLYQGFIVPTNAMAPTILARHWKGTCPECGKAAYCTPRDERYGGMEPLLMICENFHVTSATDVDKTVHPGDHFLVAKFLTPQRWDLMVFQYPEEPETLFVKRLVGLPGEEILIKDGSLWINGERQTPPAMIEGIEYLAELPSGSDMEMWGTGERSALLGADEYFVLGDFSAQSMDSRLWKTGAPGHNPFAVPQSYIKGVVTHTHWPLHRWRIHR